MPAPVRRRGGDVALLYAGDPTSSGRGDARGDRLSPVVDAMRRAGITAGTVVWHDRIADDVATRLRDVAAVLVWCNPIEDGHRRDRLDELLGELAERGVLVSAHPDAIRRVGTKDVLWETRDLPFGSDVARIDGLDQLDAELLERLAVGPRVLKQHRGQSGVGVWRVELAADGTLLVRHAERGSAEERLDISGLRERMRPYFDREAGGHLIDQPWQARISEGMVRAYLVEDRVVGFGHQAVNALHPDLPDPGPRLYHGPDEVAFQPLRERLESGWVSLLCERVGLAEDHVPLLWDLDFMFGDPTADDPEPFVLCEANVSSVAPFPPSAIEPLVAAVRSHLI